MKKINYRNHLGEHNCFTDVDANILTSLLRSFAKGVRYGCQIGVCHQCLMTLKEGEIEWIISKDEKAKLELMSDEILACQCKALSDITIEQR